MYCQKLKELLAHKGSKQNGIDLAIIEKLDLFLRKHVSVFEKENINPAKFATVMNVDYQTTIKLFFYGYEVKLFSPKAQYNCQCGEKMFIYDFDERIDCPSGCSIIPSEHCDRISMYFALNDQVTDCDFINHNKTIADMYRGMKFEKNYSSFSDFREVLGEKEAKDLVSTTREKTFDEYLKE